MLIFILFTGNVETLDSVKWLEEFSQESLPVKLGNEDVSAFVSYKLGNVDTCLSATGDDTNYVI